MRFLVVSSDPVVATVRSAWAQVDLTEWSPEIQRPQGYRRYTDPTEEGRLRARSWALTIRHTGECLPASSARLGIASAPRISRSRRN